VLDSPRTAPYSHAVLLVVDIGNTNTKVGVCDASRLLASWTLTTRREQTGDEYGLFIEALLRTRGIAPSDIRGVAISNVVPPVQQAFESMSEKYFGQSPFTVTAGVDGTLPLAVDEPREVGPDRIVAAVAGQALYGVPLIVVDMGTATRFDCINGRGEFVGGAIAPGLTVAVDALLSRAARLYRVEIARPKTAIGRNTVTNIQSGVVYGFAGLVDGLVERMKAEMDGTPAVVATGGMAWLIGDVARSVQHVNPDLKLEGLRLIYQRAST
jgi:type III pantothenate kinase